MSDQNDIRIGNRSDALDVFEKLMRSIKGEGDIGGYVETICGEGPAIDCLRALQDALERGII